DVELPARRPFLPRQFYDDVVRYFHPSHAVALLSDVADVAQGRGLPPLGPLAHYLAHRFQPEIAPRFSGVYLDLGEVSGQLQQGKRDIKPNRRYHPQNRPFIELIRPLSSTPLVHQATCRTYHFCYR